MEHPCGCDTGWDDDEGHPLYREACATHKRLAGTWLVSEPRKPVKASA